jgi:RsiW-degrading membrane proteinase PrsW (M82 family)
MAYPQPPQPWPAPHWGPNQPGWPAPPVAPVRSWSALTTPSFWLLLVALVLGGLASAALLALMIWNAPRAAAVTAPMLVGYTVAFLFLLRALDYRRQPVWLVIMALLWGGGVAVAAGAGSGWGMDQVLGQAVSAEFASLWGAALVAPTAEEIAKGLGVLMLLLAAGPHLRTPFRGAIYGAFVGLGFMVVEDATYALSAADEALPDDVPSAVRILLLRFVVPGLFGHPLFTALVGAGVGYALTRTGVALGRRWAVLTGAFAISWLVHAMVNAPIGFWLGEFLTDATGAAELAGFLLVVALPGAVGIWWLARLRRTDAAEFTAQLTRPGGPDRAPTDAAPATEAEAAGLTSRSRRARVRREVRRAHGRPAARAAGDVQRRLLRVAELLALAPSSFPPAQSPYPPVPPSYPQSPYPPVAPSYAPAGAAGGWPQPPALGPALPSLTALEWWQARMMLAADRARLARLTGSEVLPTPVEPVQSVPAVVVGLTSVAAVAGLVWWPVAVVAAVAAGGLLAAARFRRRLPSRPTVVAAVLAAYTGYVWLANLLVLTLYPDQL